MADEASAPATAAATPATPVPLAVAQPQLSSTSLVHKLILKLDDSNFLSWKQHVEGIVRTHRLQSFLAHPEIPPRWLSEDDRVNAVENPAYQIWEQQDSALFTWLLSSLSPSVLPTVVNCTQSWQIWEAVLDFFQAQSLAQSTQLRSELRSITKGSKTSSEFLKRIKSIVNALVSIGDPVTYREHLVSIGDPVTYRELQQISAPGSLTLEQHIMLPMMHL
uniref:Retrotransposon Copia-like N-terminal domain-containing protein n=1 Tax=Lotus japonicus TaxID=34305 RepID=I3T814_LOTJA|nr:unknown [Lotus japonicus]